MSSGLPWMLTRDVNDEYSCYGERCKGEREELWTDFVLSRGGNIRARFSDGVWVSGRGRSSAATYRCL